MIRSYHPLHATLTRRRVHLTVLAVAAVAYLAYRLPSDVANTYIAYGRSLGDAGDLAGTEAAFARSRAWNPQDTEAPWIRAHFYRRHRQFKQAATEWHYLAQMLPRDIDSRLSQSEVMLRMGRPVQAVRVAEEAVQIAREELDLAVVEGSKKQIRLVLPIYAKTLNALAYTRALAMHDLDRGLHEIDAALQIMQQFNHVNGLTLGVDPNMLDTRGYLRFLLGDLPGAFEDLEGSVRSFREQYHQAVVLTPWQQTNQIVLAEEEDPQVRGARTSLAVGHHHLGLVRAALGHDLLARDDFAIAQDLGYNPQEGVW